ncbi:membrane protein [Pseudomonas amygdali pv. eriobotryae]|uniref:Membrane protein n=1 Tax=Pseudomonas amygdali pv. eriobotryae TaxID=129137 RepID=A0A9P3AJC2_PSEA0|nr:YitT family protein [Pseudomonas amygdali]GFZ62815.1 membrane protein [Pseudomonas amygdali pv. eriobotryae]GFZ68845.1 membrane protein [Pseudomonas amygdali pv. eriobotryae]
MSSNNGSANKLIDAPRNKSHSVLEDTIAILISTLLVSFGLVMLKFSSLVTGGTAGLALLISYATHLSFSTVFVLLNVPFFYLAIRRMGWKFTLKTSLAIGLIAVFSSFESRLITIITLDQFYGVFLGSTLLALGFLILFRHQSSLGGISVLAVYLQERYGFRAGYFQLGLDVVIMSLSLMIVDPVQVAYSLLGVVVLNLIVAMNHRPGRYFA